MSRVLRRLTLDWKDALLFGFGFAGAIAGATMFDVLSHFAVTVALAPSVVRRLIFGPVTPPRTRRGVLWSLVSMAGLLLVLAGAGGRFVAALRPSRGLWLLPWELVTSFAAGSSHWR